MLKFSIQSALRVFGITGIILGCLASGAIAEDWRVQRTSGGSFLVEPGKEPVKISRGQILLPGAGIQTDRRGRVLLVRGKETVLISPNSVMSLPKEKPQQGRTTILQQAGRLLLEVEKKNVQHFEVETPYLTAVVKGTRFSVNVDRLGSKVDVERGKVQVADLRSGQFVLVTPGQTARTSALGKSGLKVSGAGKLNPIQSGPARKARVKRVPVPKRGLGNPKSNGSKRAGAGNLRKGERSAHVGRKIRLNHPIGAVRLSVHRATNGMSRSNTTNRSADGRKRAGNAKVTIWKSPNKANRPVARGLGKSTSVASGGHGALGGNAAANAGGNAAANAAANAGSNGIGVAGANGNSGGKGKK